ncbi:sugar transferase [Leucobacter sp. USHLN154]|uniref:sugar transferase n=1 Tax=Leucobacter sp. USHLN154 TaxID=3081269 RepID=UPI003015B877
MGLSARAWEKRYGRKLLITDSAVVVATVFTVQIARFGFTPEELAVRLTQETSFMLTYTLVSVVLIIAWLAALAIGDSRDPKIFGSGPAEYKRVVNLTLLTFGVFAIVSYVARAQVGRGFLLFALPVGLVLLLVSRWLWRKRLHRQRRLGRHIYRTLIVGDRAKSAHVAKQIMRDRFVGFGLVGAVTSRGSQTELVPGLDVVASYDDLMTTIDAMKIDAVIMTSADAISPTRKREIGWELESRKIDLVVASALTDIAGPRIHMRQVSGLPLIHVEHPKFVGRKLFAKRMFDILGSGALLLALSPVFLITAVAVKLGSQGPVFYAQQRIGLHGSTFPMYKFRSMVQGADDQLQSLLDLQGTADQPLHKVANDPRITRVGHFIRKYSIDELPQLVNVILGSMSLVGPRPQRDAEVALYAKDHYRRLLVKPGVSGLWQVSGRSNMEWEDAIRLDLYYVENWSMTGDFLILMKTVRAVVKPYGAV